MCHGPYAPPLVLLPLLLMVGAVKPIVQGFSSLGHSIENSSHQFQQWISNNNEKMKQLVSKRRDMAIRNDKISKIEIQELIIDDNEQLIEWNEDLEETLSLLLQTSLMKIELKLFEASLVDLKNVMKILTRLNAINQNGIFSKDSFIVHYLIGLCYDGLNENEGAAHSFKLAIENRLEIEEYYLKNYSEEDLEDYLTTLENQFFSMKLNANDHSKKAILSISREISNMNTNLTNFGGQFKNFVNHTLKLNTEKPVLKNKPKHNITLELLYMRAGISYYKSALYPAAYSMFTSAIEIGSNYDSSNLEINYFNRGLCEYYQWNFQHAIQDFTTSISLMPLHARKFEYYITRAEAYSRIGNKKEKSSDITKAKLINPFCKPVTVFHYRFLPDDLLHTIFSFLTVRELVLFAGADRYWYKLVESYFRDFSTPVTISVGNLIGKYSSKKLKVHGGQEDLIMRIMTHDMLRNATDIRVMKSSKFICNGGWPLADIVMLNYRGIKRLTICETRKMPEPLSVQLNYLSPHLEYLEFRPIGKCEKPNNFVELISKLASLKHLVIAGIIEFDPTKKNPFKHCKSLEIVEFEVESPTYPLDQLIRENPKLKICKIPQRTINMIE